MLGSAEDRLLVPEVRDANERLIVGVLDDGLDDGERPVVRQHPVTILQCLDRLRPLRGVNGSSGWKAADRLTALLLARVEERRGGRLEPAVDDLVDELLGQVGVAGGQRERHHDDAVLEALEVALPVEGLQRVGGVVLERTQERREPELLGVGPIEQRLDEVARVLVEHLTLVVVLLDEVVELLVLVVEEHRVLVDVLQKVLMGGFPVLVELDLAVGVVQIEHRVERVVVRLAGKRVRAGGYRLCSCDGWWHVCSFQKSSRPARTAATSSSVPMSSKR